VRDRSRNLRIEIADTTSPTIVSLAGEIDLTSSRRLREVLLSIANAGEHRVVVDMTNVTFMDSTGLAALVTARKRLTSMDGEIVLRGPSPGVRKLLEITGLLRVFTVE
jgi:anti-sigma B factor antagonist